jgi:hypothetical protein
MASAAYCDPSSNWWMQPGGGWRVLWLFEEHALFLTVDMVGLALVQKPQTTADITAADYDVVSHTWGWHRNGLFKIREIATCHDTSLCFRSLPHNKASTASSFLTLQPRRVWIGTLQNIANVLS